jgi:AmmeMemoRadiSam system protein A
VEAQSFSTLTEADRLYLLRIARESIQAAVEKRPLPAVALAELPPQIVQPGACFVTLNRRRTGELRGCTGVLVARSPLVEEVIHTAAQTALRDPRFQPVRPSDVDDLSIEISILTPPERLVYKVPDEIPDLLRPGIDGVTLSKEQRRATFLPQVWEKIPDPVEFLDRLCLKMGLLPGAWRKPGLSVDVYQVVEFSDQKAAEH